MIPASIPGYVLAAQRDAIPRRVILTTQIAASAKSTLKDLKCCSGALSSGLGNRGMRITKLCLYRLLPLCDKITASRRRAANCAAPSQIRVCD
jgi:hypothetical protein